MQPASATVSRTGLHAGPVPRAGHRIGAVLSGIAIAFMAFDSVIKLMRIQPVLDSLIQLGYPVTLAVPIGIIELACLAAYVVPRTSPLGAVLMTGYLGGAIATHVRVGSPLFSHVLFPVYVALLIWAGLYLRDRRLHALISPATGEN